MGKVLKVLAVIMLTVFLIVANSSTHYLDNYIEITVMLFLGSGLICLAGISRRKFIKK